MLLLFIFSYEIISLAAYLLIRDIFSILYVLFYKIYVKYVLLYYPIFHVYGKQKHKYFQQCVQADALNNCHSLAQEIQLLC